MDRDNMNRGRGPGVPMRVPMKVPMRVKVMSVFGTRPEAIKMAPVIKAVEARSDRLDSVVCATSQHRQMQDQALEVFSITPHHDLDLMKPGQSLDDVVGSVLPGVGRIIAQERPDIVLVQGDTSTAFAAGLAAFHARVPVGHVEAGLRSHQRHAPFPEEINRKMLSALADWHFPPTEHAAKALRNEGHAEPRIVVTGNTVVDALHWVLDHTEVSPGDLAALGGVPTDATFILVTGHRRESFGGGFEQICSALERLARRHPDAHLVYPVHLNPQVQEPVFSLLGGLDNVHLLPPLPYVTFVRLLQRASFIISDSGGIQEEATALGKPVLVMRSVTERPEAVDAGVTRLVGTDPDLIVSEAERLIDDPDGLRWAAEAVGIYGDGKAAERIVDTIERHISPEVSVTGG